MHFYKRKQLFPYAFTKMKFVPNLETFYRTIYRRRALGVDFFFKV